MEKRSRQTQIILVTVETDDKSVLRSMERTNARITRSRNS